MERKFSPELEKLRKQAADVARQGRLADRELAPGFEETRSRGLGLYVRGLGGLKHFLDYARSLPGHDEKAKLLEIGAGTTRALSELEGIPEWGHDLDLLGTSVTVNKKVDEFLGREKLRLTSAEVLRGILEIKPI